jgi:hypothetical protein
MFAIELQPLFSPDSISLSPRGLALLGQNVRFSLQKQVPHTNSFNTSAKSLRFSKRCEVAPSPPRHCAQYCRRTQWILVAFETDSSRPPTLNFRMWKCEKPGARSAFDSGNHEVPLSVLTEFQGADLVSVNNRQIRLNILSLRLKYYKFIVECIFTHKYT